MDSGFHLGFFVWRGVDPKKFLEPRRSEKKFFRSSRGVRGHAPLEKFEKKYCSGLAEISFLDISNLH